MLSIFRQILALATTLENVADGHAADTQAGVLRRDGAMEARIRMTGPVDPAEVELLAGMGVRQDPGPPVCRGGYQITTYTGEVNCGALGFVVVLVEVLEQPEVEVTVGGRQVVVSVPVGDAVNA